MQQTSTILDRYQVSGELLKCRFSTLLNVADMKTGDNLVMRRLHDAIPGDTPQRRRDARMQIMREGRILSLLRHRNLPRVMDVMEDENHAYLLLEDFAGQTLENYVKNLGSEMMDQAMMIRWLSQMVSVLHYLHSQNPPIIHRDLHPGSIMVTPHGVIKIAEFGLAKIVEDSESSMTLFKAMGHPRFAAPEQLLQSPSIPANDVYSLGAIFHYLATKKPPKNSMDRFEIPGKDEEISAINKGISPEFQMLISKMMEPKVESRLADMAAVQEEMLKSIPVGLSISLSLPAFICPPPSRAEVASVSAAGALEEKPSQSLSKAAPAEKKENLWENILNVPGWFGGEKGVSAAPTTAAPQEKDLEKFPFVDLTTLQIDRGVGKLLTQGISKSIQGVCIGRAGRSQITVAVKDPTQVYIYDHISYATQGSLKPSLVRADPVMIDLAREFIYDAGVAARKGSWLEWIQQKKYEADALDVKSTEEETDLFKGELKGPVIEAVDKIIKEAISIGASDIHMENSDVEMVVRYRIDGVLHVVGTYGRKMAGAIVKRVKITAGMDISQDRITQGGRISVRVADREFDLRVSIVPVPFGENVVMRLLPKGNFNYSLKTLGFGSDCQEKYLKILGAPHGMILVSGPTGSGKSTTLYASLAEINRPDRKLLTVEDPIEYQLPGITQVQVNMAPKDDSKKVTFSNALREFLRQDPDVILVGEIRDEETAAIAVQAALTGHLLLSTIHTNNAVGILTRLEDMGVEPYLISSTLVGGIAQRLVRKVCPHCKEEVEPPADLLEIFKKKGIADYHLFKGKGCVNCHHTGNKGRLALYEILEISDQIRPLITARAEPLEISRMAKAQGMRELYDDGIDKVAEGLIAYEEVLRVTMAQ